MNAFVVTSLKDNKILIAYIFYFLILIDTF